MSATGDKIFAATKTLILDFDGTLVDSNPIKWQAFEKCFAGYPYFEAIMAYCRENNHAPRRIKFRHVFENILKQSYTEETEKKLLDQYAAETTQQVIDAPEIPGAQKFLETFALNRLSILLSSTPHDVLEFILKKRGMEKYFKVVQGAPVDKAAWLRQFFADRKLGKGDALFLGDSEEDARSAEEAGIPFISVGPHRRSPALLHLENFLALCD